MATPTPDPKNLKEVNKELGFIEDALTNISVLLTSKIEEAFENIGDSTKTIADIYANNLEKSIKGMAKNSDAILKNTMSALSGELKVKDVKKLQEKLELQQLATKRNIEKLKALGLVSDAEANRLQADLVDNYQIQKALLEDQLDIAKKQDNIFKDIGNEFKNKINKEAFTTLGILKFILDAALKSDEQTTALAKSFGVTKSAAKEIRDNMVSFSRAADSSFVNVTRLFKAQQALTEQLGIAVDFGGKEQEQFARLTEIVGLSAEEAGKLAKFSAATGMSTDKYVASIRESVFFAQRANGIHVSDKEILSTISKLSAGILVKFQNNPKAIAEAVVQAKKLGTTLEQMDKTAESLLNFESSIENELKAELITGRKLNFERAREAALSGDQATLMREMVSQAGSLADFQNMNVIAQKSLAEAFGMSREEMSEMLMKQEAINKYGDKAAELNAKQLKDFQESGLTLEQYLEKQDQQRSIQEKFNDAISKLQDLVGNLVAGPFGRLLDIMISITEQTKLLAALASVYIARLVVINLLKAREAILAKKSASNNIVDAVASAVKSASGIPVVGWVIGAGLAAGLFATLSGMFSKGDDVISPGYGKRMLLDEGSITAFNDNDTIIAGTNLGGKRGNNTNRGGSDAGVIAAIERLASRPAVAYINGREAFANSLGSTSALGTSQMQNTSYRLA